MRLLFVSALFCGLIAPLAARADCDSATLSFTHHASSECRNAFEAHDYGGASVYCAHAAESAGTCADNETGWHRDLMLLSKSMSLTFEAASYGKLGRYDDERDLIRTAKSVLHEVVVNGSRVEYRNDARSQLAEIKRIFNM